jgi:uncharacterized repeat protein (TIGR03803 family)
MTRFFRSELPNVLRRISARLTRMSALILLFSRADCGADTFRILHHFPKPSGPTGTLLVSGEMIYGVTEWGGPANAGTVFRINTNGQAVTVFHEFAGTDGHEPRAGLVLSGDTLYGTTLQGGLFQEGKGVKL